MKAAYFMKCGGPEVMEYGDVPDPVAGAGDVMVDVHAASVNGADWKVRSGRYAPITSFPYVPGRDFSGVVSSVGDGVRDLRVGDEVFGVLDVGHEGAYAEKVAVQAAIVARKPVNLSHLECAAIALVGLTALVSVEDTLELAPGERILVQGGAGGVASLAIQIAKHIGTRVITTTSAANADYVRQFGADQVIDYAAQDFTKEVSGLDAVFDTVGGDVANKCFAVLKPGGRAAFIASGVEAPKPTRSDVVSLRPPVERSRQAMERIAGLIETGAVRPPAIKLYSLSQAVEAHRLSESRHFRGKLVFQVR